MRFKKILLSCLLVAGAFSASAQEQQPRIEYIHNPYWYVQLQAGGQYTLGEIDFCDLLSPNIQVALGRQFTPVFGLRLAVNGWQSRAGVDFGRQADWKWNYIAPGLDATFNLTNLFGTYNPTRLFNLSVFAGLGANIGWNNKKDQILADYKSLFPTMDEQKTQNVIYAWDGTKTRLVGRAGIAADFRVNDAVTLGIEANANTLNDKYNSKRGSDWDWYFNVLAGVKINLGTTYTTRTIEAPKPVERVVEKIVERIVEKEVPVPTPVPAEEAKVEPLRRDIFFTIRATQVTKDQQHKVKEVADYLKAHPNATVEVTGYADKGTGNATINRSLSERRAQAVYTMLTKTYGIAPSRIKTDAKGDTVQPFAKDIENRVTICIAQ